MTTKFDPTQHILVVRDATSGRHVHVAWVDVLQQIAATPQATTLDLAPIIARIEAMERRPESPLVADTGLSQSVADASAALANIAARLNKLEAAYSTHEHDYKLADDQLKVIASAVLDQIRRAGVKAA